MKKLLVLVLVFALAVLTAACSWQSTVEDYSGEVSFNGGFSVVKGDYVYLINGKADNTDDNTFGKVVKGAIIRVKTADIGKEDAAAEIVVPKIVYTEYYGSGSGIFISGDYVYYPTPSDKKNSSGVVKNTEIEFIKTKLDGTGSSVIATVAALDAPYRFYEKGGKVYLTVLKTETVDGSAEDHLVTYDEDGNELKKSKKVAGYDLGEFGGANAYYVRTAYNETLEQDESYNEVYRYAYDGSEDVMILNGVSGFNDKENGIGTQGATFEIKKNAQDYLFLSMKYVDTSVVESTVYYAIAHSALTADAKANLNIINDGDNKINDGDNKAATIFASNSVYLSKNAIIYNDSDYGLVSYNYQSANKAIDDGLVYLFDDETVKSYTFEYSEGDYLYYSNEGFYYRLNVKALVDETTGLKKNAESVKMERLTYKKTYASGDWFNAEFVGEKMLYVNTDSPYYSYVYALGLKDIETKYGKALADISDEEIEEYVELLVSTEKEDVLNALKLRVGILSEADKTATDEYFN